MTLFTLSLGSLAAGGRTFAVSAAVGALFALGVRALFQDAPVPIPAPADDPKMQPPEAGHAGHTGHGEPAPQSEPEKKADAGEPAAPTLPAAPNGVLLDLGNATCPVMQGDVDAETFTEWNGLRVGHCCPGCSKRFLKDPETLLDEVAPKWREALAAAKAIETASGAEREKALAAAQKRWKVIRSPAVAVTKGVLLDLGNATCPVRGGEVDCRTFTEWKGLRIGHCCPGCEKALLARPEELLDAAVPGWRDAAKAVEAVNAAQGEEREKALAAAGKRWKIVRRQ